MIAQKRQLRERKFVNYVQKDVRIRKSGSSATASNINGAPPEAQKEQPSDSNGPDSTKIITKAKSVVKITEGSAETLRSRRRTPAKIASSSYIQTRSRTRSDHIQKSSTVPSTRNRSSSQSESLPGLRRTINRAKRYSPSEAHRLVDRESGAINISSQEKEAKSVVNESRSNAVARNIKPQPNPSGLRQDNTPRSSSHNSRSTTSRLKVSTTALSTRASSTRASRSKSIGPESKSARAALPSRRPTDVKKTLPRGQSALSTPRSRSVRSDPVKVLLNELTPALSIPSEKKVAPEIRNQAQETEMPGKKRVDEARYDLDIDSESKPGESSEEESESDITSDEDDDHCPAPRAKLAKHELDMEVGEYPKLETSDYSYGKYQSSFTASSDQSRVPAEFYEMRTLWAKLLKDLPVGMLPEYKACLRGHLTGRLSCLNPITENVLRFPQQLVSTHNRLYGLLCQSSGAYPFKNHEGSTLASKHHLADTSQIGAQIMLECLNNGVLPFDTTTEITIMNQIQTYVRIGIKDMLQEIFEQLPADRTNIIVSDLKESLVSRLLE